MKIKKRSGEFRGNAWCATAREWEELSLERPKNSYYDNAIIVKEIVRGYLKGEYELQDFADLVSQGVEDDYITEKTGELRRNQLVKCIERYCRCESRKAYMPGPKELEVKDYIVTVKPDAVFDDGSTIELVIYRAGKPDVTQRGQKRDGCVEKCLELYFLFLYGRSLVPEGEIRTVQANYYYLRKSTDGSSKQAADWDPDFFSGKGGNIVGIEGTVLGGACSKTEMDQKYLGMLEEYSVGQECTADDCKKCQWNNVCNYVELPKLYEAKTNDSKNGRIIPSDSQRAVIEFRTGICRVNAAAGSGKTECITERGAQMFEEGIRPSEILFITFTDAGANEMKIRISRKCQARGLPISGDDIQAMTFNTFAYRIVKDNYQECGFTKPPQVIDDVRNSVIIEQMLDENVVNGLDYLNFTMEMPNCYGALACAKKVFETIKCDGIAPDDPEAAEKIMDSLSESSVFRFMELESVRQLVGLYPEYDKRLKEDNLLQFADQEPIMMKFLDSHPGYLEQFGYKHIVVDEFQDSNDIQLETIRRLMSCRTFQSLMVVGDDSQAIYGFRHTSPDNILHFFEKMGKTGKDLYLKENRRSVPEILDLANYVNALNKERVEKDMEAVRSPGHAPIVQGFHNKADEYGYIAEKIKSLIRDGMQPEDIAFIAFKKTELVAMGAELTKLDIPWVMMCPLPFMENSNVKAAMSLAEAFYQPEAEQLYFNYLCAKYHGQIFQCRSIEEIRIEVENMKRNFTHMDLLPIDTQRSIYHNYLDALSEGDEIYQSFLDLIYANEDFQSELEYIRNFSRYGERAGKKMEQKYQGVVLTTAHSSKGLEWKAVFNSITNYDDRSLHSSSPKTRARVEETRRLLFVSITRARDLLYITGQYVSYGKKDDRTYNQFLREVYDALDQEYCPIDPMEDIKAAERKRKADSRRKRRSALNGNITPGEISEEQRALYASMVRGAQQITIFDLA